jgi:transglutaminase-like putative cysteine protease
LHDAAEFDEADDAAATWRARAMTILKVRHVTSYAYKRPVGFGEHRILFRPRDSHDQRLLDSSLAISPTPSEVFWIHDVFGNSVAVANFAEIADTLRIETNIVLDHTPQFRLHYRTDDAARTWPFAYDDETLLDLAASITRQYPNDNGAVENWARRFVSAGATETASMLETMTGAIRADFKYVRRTNPGTQTPAMTLDSLSGTCRDFALLMMEAARALGLAARFVTGYIYVAARDTEELLGGGATHAWAQIFLPGAGWVEFDPTNGIIGNRDLIRVGVARDPRQAIPLWGTHTGKRNDSLGMTVQVNVTSAGPERGTPAIESHR